MDKRRDTPCGPAVKKLCERACEVFGQMEYAALASISVSHLYNRRKSMPYTRNGNTSRRPGPPEFDSYSYKLLIS